MSAAPFNPAALPIGPIRAGKLLAELAGLGLKVPEMYKLAGQVLGRPVSNFASLPEEAAAQVWRAAKAEHQAAAELTRRQAEAARLATPLF